MAVTWWGCGAPASFLSFPTLGLTAGWETGHGAQKGLWSHAWSQPSQSWYSSCQRGQEGAWALRALGCEKVERPRWAGATTCGYYQKPQNHILWCERKVSVSCSVVSESTRPHGLYPPGSSVHGILQARILEWHAIPFSRGSSQLRDWILVSCTAGGFFTIWAPGDSARGVGHPKSLGPAALVAPPQTVTGSFLNLSSKTRCFKGLLHTAALLIVKKKGYGFME